MGLHDRVSVEARMPIRNFGEMDRMCHRNDGSRRPLLATLANALYRSLEPELPLQFRYALVNSMNGIRWGSRKGVIVLFSVDLVEDAGMDRSHFDADIGGAGGHKDGRKGFDILAGNSHATSLTDLPNRSDCAFLIDRRFSSAWR